MGDLFDSVEAVIKVRRVYTTDTSRHLARWVDQRCRVDIINYALNLQEDFFSLRCAEVLVHHYSTLGPCLVVRFPDSNLEINMLFESVFSRDIWFKAINRGIRAFSDMLETRVPHVLMKLTDHLQMHYDPDKVMIKRHVESGIRGTPTCAAGETDDNEGTLEACFSGNILEWKSKAVSDFKETIQTTLDNYIQPLEIVDERKTVSLSLPSTRPNGHCPATMVWNAEKVVLQEQEDNGFVLVDEVDDRISHRRFYSTGHENELSCHSNQGVSKVLPLRDRDRAIVSGKSSSLTDTRLMLSEGGCRVVGENHSLAQMHKKIKTSRLLQSLRAFTQIPVPKIAIVILAVGTRGDIQPFIMIGKRLKNDGHRVRLATHENFRSLVIKSGLEFYPLGGDPVKLSEYMVKSQGWIVPTNQTQLLEAPAYMSMISEILFSCWGACTSPDPLDSSAKAFRATAIIANPVSYGHVHCAEALGVPLHMMFPQPWISTKAFPHPLSFFDPSKIWNNYNYLSYQMIDRVLWLSMEFEINRFRRDVLKIRPIWMTLAQGGFNFLEICKVPFVKLWSPLLAPKPKDWENHVDIVGCVFDKQEELLGKAGVDGCGIGETIPEIDGYVPSRELIAFLDGRPGILQSGLMEGEASINRGKPIFLGFGSMVVGDLEVKRLVKMVLRGAAMAGVRILIQSGWGNVISSADFYTYAQEAYEYAKIASDSLIDESLIFPSIERIPSDGNLLASTSSMSSSFFGDSKFLRKRSLLPGGWSAESDAFLLGPCQHSWLFPRVAAVVHHGGAGTTSAGLRAGKPTFICPFFGDQHFWGERVHSLQLGPKPCPVVRLTEIILAESFQVLLDPEIQTSAQEIGLQMSKEDGLENAVDAFYRNLPTSSMICEVSLFLGEIKLAEVNCRHCGINMCSDVYELIHWGRKESSTSEDHEPRCIKIVDWEQRRLRSQRQPSSMPSTSSTWVPESSISSPALISGIADYSKSILSNLLSAANTVVQTVISKTMNDRTDDLLTEECNGDLLSASNSDDETSPDPLDWLEKSTIEHKVPATEPRLFIPRKDHIMAKAWDEAHELTLEALDTAQWLKSVLVELNSLQKISEAEISNCLHMASLEKILEVMQQRDLLGTEDIISSVDSRKLVLQLLSRKIVGTLNDSSAENKISFLDFAMIILGAVGMAEAGDLFWKKSAS